MTNPTIACLRLRSQRISGAKFSRPEDVARGLGALQAQDYGQVLWGIGLRTASATAADIGRAVADRKIVLTWPLRGTLHAVPAEDAKWMLKLSSPRVLARSQRRREQLELDPPTLERCGNLLYDALKGNKRVTRPELMRMFEEAGIAAGNQRGYHLLWYHALTGMICLGPLEGKQQTFALLDEWVPGSREMSHEEALTELALRYFSGHGPASVHDFAWWAGQTIAEAKKGIEGAQSGLQSVRVDGELYWMSKDTPDKREEEGQDVFLLPGFDEYLLGYKDRSAVLSPEHAPLIVPGGNGVFLPTVVASGRVAGTWKRTMKKTTVDIGIVPFEPLEPWEIGIMAEARRYAGFMGLALNRASLQP